jgi:hypothetical protein
MMDWSDEETSAFKIGHLLAHEGARRLYVAAALSLLASRSITARRAEGQFSRSLTAFCVPDPPRLNMTPRANNS